MKTFCKTILVGLALISTFGLQAQATGNKLDQVDLMKKFVGRWQCELGKDTIMISDNIVFGTGLICSSQIIANDKILESAKQLYGYDKKTDKFIIAELIVATNAITKPLATSKKTSVFFKIILHVLKTTLYLYV